MAFGGFGGIVPWRRDPFEMFRREFDRMFDRFFGEQGYSASMTREGGGWAPEADIAETDKEYLVTVELPGVEEKDVKLTVSDNTLRVHGEKKLEKEERGARWLYRSRNYGMFDRVVTLPERVESGKVRARYRKGCLEVTLPKSEASGTKQIQIEAGEKEK